MDHFGPQRLEVRRRRREAAKRALHGSVGLEIIAPPHDDNVGWIGDRTPRVLYRCEKKGVDGKGICKCLKIHKIKIDVGGQTGKRDL
jgi:hypothetical protein